MLGSTPHWKWRFTCFWTFSLKFCCGQFSWQAQYLRRLEGDTCCSAHCKWGFDMWWGLSMWVFLRDRRTIWRGWLVTSVVGAVFGEVPLLFFVVGTVFGEVQVSVFVAGAALGEGQVYLFVAGAAPGEGLNVRLGAENVVFYNRKCFWGPRKVTSLARRVAVCVFTLGSCSDHGWIMLGSCSDRPPIRNHFSPVFGHFLWNLFCGVNFRGRRSICGGWRGTPVAPRIVNEVWYVMRIKHVSLSAWQAHYLARLARDICCSAHCKWRFICDAD